MPYGVDGQWYANQWDASAKGDYISAGYLAQQEANAAALARTTNTGTTGKYIAPKAAAKSGAGFKRLLQMIVFGIPTLVVSAYIYSNPTNFFWELVQYILEAHSDFITVMMHYGRVV